MKSKVTTYILIAGVLVIWGIILWKVFSPKDDAPQIDMTPRKVVAVEEVVDTLMLNYRDPFLGAIPTKPIVNIRSVPLSVPMQIIEQEPPPEHRLRYLGQITRASTPHSLVEINGVLHTMRKGDTAEGYRLTTIWQDSVALKWKNELLVIRIGQ